MSESRASSIARRSSSWVADSEIDCEPWVGGVTLTELVFLDDLVVGVGDFGGSGIRR